MATFADTNAFTITVASASAPVTVSGAVTAQAATTSGTVTAFAVVDASGAVSAQAATTSGTVTAFAVVDASGAVTAQAATTSGNVNAITPGVPVDVSGAVSAQAATTSGTVTAVSPAVPVDVSGAVSAQAATTSGNVTAYAVIDASGAVTAQAASTTGNVVAGGELLPPYDLKLKTPTGAWLDINDHTTLKNVGTNTHAQIDTHIADSGIHFSDSVSADGQLRSASGWVNGIQLTNAAGAVQSQPTDMQTLTQAEYDGLTPDANTLYIIVG
jgi:hypothetical protein